MVFWILLSKSHSEQFFQVERSVCTIWSHLSKFNRTCLSRGLTSPQRSHITSFSNWNKFPNLVKISFFFCDFSHSHLKLLWCSWHFYYFKVIYMYIVLARGKGHNNNAHRDLFKSKKPKQKNPQTSSCILHILWPMYQSFSLTDFSKCLKNFIFSRAFSKHICWPPFFMKGWVLWS